MAQDYAAGLALLRVSLNQLQASLPHSAGGGSVSGHSSAGKSLDVVINDVVSYSLLLPSSGTECSLILGMKSLWGVFCRIQSSATGPEEAWDLETRETLWEEQAQ